ncbi:MAG: hypothetical protein L6R35_002205 [Caloplaca aegaea]|nr:MAG: hypothetical protein L6R35_002205 [Caloplaca aegaea]
MQKRHILTEALQCSFHDNPEQDPLPSGPDADKELHRKWDTDWGFSGVSTFAHLKHVRCLSERDVPFDIGVIGAPFDTAVTYRPGQFCFHK